MYRVLSALEFLPLKEFLKMAIWAAVFITVNIMIIFVEDQPPCDAAKAERCPLIIIYNPLDGGKAYRL